MITENAKARMNIVMIQVRVEFRVRRKLRTLSLYLSLMAVGFFFGECFVPF